MGYTTYHEALDQAEKEYTDMPTYVFETATDTFTSDGSSMQTAIQNYAHSTEGGHKKIGTIIAAVKRGEPSRLLMSGGIPAKLTITATGPRGCGKSTLISRIAAYLVDHNLPVIGIDPHTLELDTTAEKVRDMLPMLPNYSVTSEINKQFADAYTTVMKSNKPYDAAVAWRQFTDAAMAYAEALFGKAAQGFTKPIEPVPDGVYYNRSLDGFYASSTHNYMGEEFYSMWKHRKTEFPNDPEQINPNVTEDMEVARTGEKSPLTLNTRDSVGRTPDPSWIGTILQHSGNSKLYVIGGICWLGANDKWGFMCHECNSDGKPVSRAITIVRPLSHLFGNRSDGSKRYIVGV